MRLASRSCSIPACGVPRGTRTLTVGLLTTVPLPYWATGTILVLPEGLEPSLCRPSTYCLYLIGLRQRDAEKLERTPLVIRPEGADPDVSEPDEARAILPKIKMRAPPEHLLACVWEIGMGRVPDIPDSDPEVGAPEAYIEIPLLHSIGRWSGREESNLRCRLPEPGCSQHTLRPEDGAATEGRTRD